MILAGLLACSAARYLPIVDWTVVCRSGSPAIARGELTATGIAPDLHRTSLLMAPRRQPKSGQIYIKIVNLHKRRRESYGRDLVFSTAFIVFRYFQLIHRAVHRILLRHFPFRLVSFHLCRQQIEILSERLFSFFHLVNQ
jgi:hypothetical protein